MDRVFSFNRTTLFDRDGVIIGGCKPFLFFEYIIKTQQFNPSPYFNSLTTYRMKLHTEIMKLHNKGWGYTKIHHHLIKSDFKISKSRTTVDSRIKNMKKGYVLSSINYL